MNLKNIQMNVKGRTKWQVQGIWVGWAAIAAESYVLMTGLNDKRSKKIMGGINVSSPSLFVIIRTKWTGAANNK